MRFSQSQRSFALLALPPGPQFPYVARESGRGGGGPGWSAAAIAGRARVDVTARRGPPQAGHRRMRTTACALRARRTREVGGGCTGEGGGRKERARGGPGAAARPAAGGPGPGPRRDGPGDPSALSHAQRRVVLRKQQRGEPGGALPQGVRRRCVRPWGAGVPVSQ